MRYSTLAIAALLWALPAGAFDTRWDLEPIERQSRGCRFVGRTVTDYQYEVAVTEGTDAAASAIVVAGSHPGGDVNITVEPNTGCATRGCRAGNVYQVRIAATLDDGQVLTCNWLVVPAWRTLKR